MLERPCPTSPLLDERMCELLLDGALTARSSQVSEHDHGVARSSLEVKLCNLPS